MRKSKRPYQEKKNGKKNRGKSEGKKTVEAKDKGENRFPV
jgi:hypothetical protein